MIYNTIGFSPERTTRSRQPSTTKLEVLSNLELPNFDSTNKYNKINNGDVKYYFKQGCCGMSEFTMH